MQERLVSILTPCYNTAYLVWRLLDSVLNQTYPYIEMFIIDDGSSDNTKELYERYSEKFHARGYILNYIYQENQGQSVAINNGLKLINGEFLVWPDSDDFYATNDAIEKMVSCLSSRGEDYAIVRSFQRMLSEDTLKEVSICSGENKDDYSLFEDCLYHINGFYFGAGAYMIRTNALDVTIGKSIYTHRHAGQNWQLLLPVLYSYKCYTLPEVLYNVLCREVSHSRSAYVGYEKEMTKFNVYEQTILNTLSMIKAMPIGAVQRYQQQIVAKYARVRMDLAYKYRRGNDFVKAYKSFENVTPKLPLQYKLYYMLALTRCEKVFESLIRIKRFFIR